MKSSARVFLLGLVLAFVFTIVFTGCGVSQGNSSSSASQNSSSVDETTAVSTTAANQLPVMGETLKYDPNVSINDEKDITLKFWVYPEVESYYNKWTQEYSKIHPNVKWKIIPSAAADLYKKLPIALQTGTGPDIFQMHNMYTQVLIPNMEPYPEDVFPRDQLNADFLGVDTHIINGNIYYIDYGMMTAGMFYNKKMWADAGLTDADIPKTWDKFREVAKKLTKTDASGKIVVAGFNMNTYMALLLNAMTFQEGYFMFDKDGKKAILNTPEHIKNAKFLYDLYNVDKVGSIKMPSNSDTFETGKAAMIYCWGWIGSPLKLRFPNIKFGFFPTPTFKGNTPAAYDRNNGESTPGVSAQTSPEAKNTAFDFIKYLLCNDDALIDYNTVLYTAPSKKVLIDRPEISRDVVLAGQAALLERTFWPGPVPGQYWGGLITYVGDEIMINNVPPDKALAKAEEIINKDLEPTGFVSVERSYKFASEFKN